MSKRYLGAGEVCESFLAIGQRKASLPLGKMFVAAMLAGAFIALAGVASTWSSMLVFLISTAMGKIMSFEDALFRGILCNVLVCLGVLMAAAGTDAGGKVLGLFFPVAAFVMAGYEHSVANMYYFMAGIFAGADLAVSDIVIRNFVPVTIGNIIGGAVILGGGYWYIYRKGTEN